MSNVIDAIKRAGTTEKLLIQTRSARFIVSLDDTFLTPRDVLDPKNKSKIRCTSGIFFLKYEPEGEKFKNPKYPYVIKTSDMLGINLHCSSIPHLHALKKIFPELAWILRNSNYSDDLFAVARAHPGMPIPFSFDVMRYYNSLMKQMNENKVNPTENKPLVIFKFAQKLPHYEIDEESFWPEKDVTQHKYRELRQIY